MKKRLIALVLAAVLICTSFLGTPVKSLAAGGLTQEKNSEEILSVKARLGVGNEYTRFEQNYSESGNGYVWYFYWYTEDYSKSIYASVDEGDHILNANKYSNSYGRTVPKYTSEELLETAEKLIERIEPGIVKNLKYKYANCRSYDSAYQYYFVRVENGIEMPDNSVNISVNYNTKDVTGYYADWLYGTEIPDSDGLIGEEAAAAKIGKNVEMQLSYYITYDEEGNPKAFLAYVPDKAYVAVDAHTGKIYGEKSYWGSRSNAVADDAKAEVSDEDSFVPTLSDAEIAAIEELKGIISAEDAVNYVKSDSALFIDENINILDYARLYKDAGGNYYWDIDMYDNRPYDWDSDDYYRGYWNARVDARTGAILSFSASLSSNYLTTPEEIAAFKANYSKTQCKKIAEDFLKRINAERFANTVLSTTDRTHVIGYDDAKGQSIYAGYAFNYDRVNEGIKVSGNGIGVSVDSVSGKIFNYYPNWTENVDFPSGKGVIGQEKAFENYIAYDGFDLVYEIETSYINGSAYYGSDIEKTVRLVYRTEISPAFVDAFTGKQLNYDGSEYVRISRDYSYTDVAGNKYERAIKILASLGAGFEGNEFKPDQVITREEFQKLADSLNGFLGYSSYKISGDKKLTRQMAAKAMTGYLGYGKMAELDIYKTGYSDEKKISKGYVGSVAIAKGLGIMKAASGRKFKPTAKVTRGEAAQILLNGIGVE